MRVDRVDRKADRLDVALVPFGLELGNGAEFGGADRSEVLGVRKENGPRVALPIVEGNAALSGVSGEVGGDIAKP